MAAVDAISAAFQDAALLASNGPTIFVSSGDSGAGFLIDGSAGVEYPASDPWVTACGGTIFNRTDALLVENSWPGSGGGISDHFGVPGYQTPGILPRSVNDGHRGRGVPDVSGNAGGYRMSCQGAWFSAAGTSAVAPLYAGMTGVLNANLGRRIGFLNPILYAIPSTSPVIHDIDDGGNNGSVGYRCVAGWDACTGLGSLNGRALLALLRGVPVRPQ
jgi:kumamolisin